MAQSDSWLKYRIWSILLFFFFPILLHAQTTGYHIERQTRFIQYLSWTPDDFALRYEVEIERETETEGIYQRHHIESTVESSVFVSMPPGKYRYRVTPYNLLNRPGRISEWLEFNIILALNPEITGFSPLSFTLGQNEKYIIQIYGNNLISEDEMYLINHNRDIIVPVEIQILNDGKEAHLHFTHDQLTAGVYQINVKNPGGLEANISGFIIYNEIYNEVTKPKFEPEPNWSVHLYLGVNWLTLMDLHGETNLSEQFLSGISMRISVITANLSFFNIGFELTPAWYSIDALFSDDITQSLLLEVNILLQKQFFNQQLALTFRAGAGINLPVNSNENNKPDNILDNSLIYLNTGLSFLWIPVKYFYTEAGVNYSHLFALDNNSSRLRPWAGVGIKF